MDHYVMQTEPMDTPVGHTVQKIIRLEFTVSLRGWLKVLATREDGQMLWLDANNLPAWAEPHEEEALRHLGSLMVARQQLHDARQR